MTEVNTMYLSDLKGNPYKDFLMKAYMDGSLDVTRSVAFLEEFVLLMKDDVVGVIALQTNRRLSWLSSKDAERIQHKADFSDHLMEEYAEWCASI